MREQQVSQAWKVSSSFGATVVGWAAAFGFYASYMTLFSGFGRPTDVAAILSGTAIFMLLGWLLVFLPIVATINDDRSLFKHAQFTTFGAVAGLVAFMALVGWWTGFWRTFLFPTCSVVAGAVSGFSYSLLLGNKRGKGGASRPWPRPRARVR